MADLEKYRGVIPAFYACYDDAGEISPERTRTLARYLIDKGVKGLYVYFCKRMFDSAGMALQFYL